MICPNCGMETDGKFCPSCGTKMPVAEDTVPAGVDEAVKQAETAAAAAQGYQPFPNRAPNPGYAAPNPGYPNQGYPNQPQGYIPYPNQAAGYVPAQGYNPGVQNTGGYRVPTQAEIGRSPASQLLRRLGSSGAFLVGVILSTVNFLLSLIGSGRSILAYVNMMDYYRGTDYEIQLAGSIAMMIFSILASALGVLLLWLIFGAAANKRSPKMGTGALTTFKVFFIIGLVGVCLLLSVVVIGGLFAVLGDDSRDLSYALTNYLNSLLAQYGVRLTLPPISDRLLALLLFGGVTICLIFSIIFIAKLLKTINTAKRVVQTGRPDDRVSPFAAVLIILGAVFTLIGAVSMIASFGGGGLISGVSALLGAAAAICFAAVIFKFRSGMRRLGVYRGVMTQPMQ